jgi:hypothetical protein
MPWTRKRAVVDVLVYEPRPVYPDQGLPPSIGGGPIFPEGGGGEGPWEPGLPEHPWVPGEGFPGFPERPGHPLPRPPRNYPIVPDGGDMPDHPHLPDLNDGGHWGKVFDPRPKSGGGQSFPAYITHPEPPQVEEDYDPKHPKSGLPGSWVAVVYRDGLTWAWCPSPPETPEPGEPDFPEREPKS